MLFKGSAVALVTPFTSENTVNYNKLEELVEFHIKNGTDAIVVCGTTGEWNIWVFQKNAGKNKRVYN